MSNPGQHPFPARSNLGQRVAAEVAGTFLLVFGLIGAALLTSPDSNGAAGQPGTGLLGVALALGLAVTIGGFAFGPISGGHFNPAVSVGAAVAGRLPWRLVPAYLVAQVIGAVAGSSVVLGLLAGGSADVLGDALKGGFASNGFDTLSPGGYGFWAVAAVEVLATAVLVFVVLATTHPVKGTKAAPLVIGLTLTSMLFVALPIDNASLNPARSFATAIYGGGDWLGQVWVFVVFPVIGALIAGLLYPHLFAPKPEAADAALSTPAGQPGEQGALAGSRA